MMKTLSILIAATVIAAPALAETFVHEGTTYVYSVEQRGNVRIIKGEDTATRRPFALTVRNGWIDGTVDGSPVSFSKRDVARLRPTIALPEIAAR